MSIQSEISRISGNVSAALTAITQKGGTVPAGSNSDNLATLISQIPTGGGGGGSGSVEEKDVNFFDYDGTIVASYTVADFKNLSAFPDNPSHSGLISQGWNWTLADAKNYAEDYGFLDIGQMYATDDGKTRVYIQLQDGRLSPIFAVAVNGTATVNFGDGSAEETLTGTNLTTAKPAQHTYQAPGKYTVTVEPADGSAIAIIGNSYGTYLLVQVLSNELTKNYVYSSCIEKVEIGARCNIGAYAFARCTNMTSLTIPSSVVAIGNSAFNTNSSIRHVTIPIGVVAAGSSTFAYSRGIRTVSLPRGVRIGAAFFQQCDSLKRATLGVGTVTFGNSALATCNALKKVSIPEGIVGLGNSFLYQSYSISEVTVPSTVTTLGSSDFSNCYGLGKLRFKPQSPPSASNSNTFYNLPTDCKIYVPSGALSAYTSASNYPSSSTYTYVEE